MVNDGSIETPAFKQIIMKKQIAQEGVKIIGYERLQKEDGTNKERRHENKRESNAPKLKGKESIGRENSRSEEKIVQEHTAQENKQEEEKKDGEEEALIREREEKGNKPNNRKDKTVWGTCKPKTVEALKVVITDLEIQAYREHMSEHAVICNFMGLWPTERALCQWIKQQWKPKGDVRLHLGAKGFFIVFFSNLEDKDRIFDGGPYFFASTGLYMRPWKPDFVPEKETFKHSRFAYSPFQ